MFGHFVFVDDAADRERNLVLAAQRLFGAMNAGRNGGEFLFGSDQQVFALAGALVRQQRIAAGDEALARIIRRRDGGEIALVKQGQLQAAGLCEAADRWRPQRGDPVEPGGLEDLLDPRLGDHAAIADQHDALQRKPLLEFFDLIGERCRIGDIAVENLDRHWAAVLGAQ
jgi:hypothetical protein